MMHGHEKSDSAIVATKLPNKAGQPAAEAVEPRAETKGNTGQQHTRRAQIRESVSQALERVRKAARQRKKEKFTALLHHISVETLEVAFYALTRKAAPGVDGVTWEEYEADLERKQVCLRVRAYPSTLCAPILRFRRKLRSIPGYCCAGKNPFCWLEYCSLFGSKEGSDASGGVAMRCARARSYG